MSRRPETNFIRACVSKDLFILHSYYSFCNLVRVVNQQLAVVHLIKYLNFNIHRQSFQMFHLWLCYKCLLGAVPVVYI